MTAPTEDPLSMLAAADPGRTAVIEDERRLTYAEFNALVNRYANLLVDHDVRAGTKVVWCGRNSTEVVAVIAALRKCGAVGVPLNYRLSPEEASYVIENADAALVLFDAEQAPQLEQASWRAASVRRWLAFRGNAPEWASSLDALAAKSPATEPVPRGEDPVAGTSMFYTSGTTGKPKGVRPRGDRPGDRARAGRRARVPARRRLPHDRPAVPLRPDRLHARSCSSWAGPSS